MRTGAVFLDLRGTVPRMSDRAPGVIPPGLSHACHLLRFPGQSDHRRSKVRLRTGSASKIIAPSLNLTCLLSVLCGGA